jgi:hypothetical protein
MNWLVFFGILSFATLFYGLAWTMFRSFDGENTRLPLAVMIIGIIACAVVVGLSV